MGLQNPRLDRDIILNRRRQLSGSKAERQLESSGSTAPKRHEKDQR